MCSYKKTYILLLILISQASAVVLGQTIKPSDYSTFKPLALGEWYNDPVFNTPIKRLTDSQGVSGFNGERAMFSADDQYFVVAVDLPAPKRLHLFDGRTGDFIRILPDFVSNPTIVRWGHDPEVLVYAYGNNLMGFNVLTDAISTIATFGEAIGDATGKLCGGDGNDFDDAGEWLLLNKGAQDANGLPSEMFAYNIRTGVTGPVKDMSSYSIDYCTISPSGQYIVGTSSLGKKWIWNRDWSNEREIKKSDGSSIGNAHMDLAYLDGTDECLVTKMTGGIWAIRFSDLEQFNVLSASGLAIIMYSAVGGSNQNHIYLAVESKGLNPDVEWHPYLGELVKVPLVSTGPGEISRLAHHRARTHDGSFHQFADQPEPWINHAGDRLFFRSNMDNYSEKGKNDLYMIKQNVVSVQTIIDQWTFTDPTTPQNSDIKNKAIDFWDPAQTDNSWLNGVLTWGHDGPSAFKTSNGAYQGDTWLGVPGGTIDQLVLTIDAKDINFSANGAYRFQFTAGTGEITGTGKVRCRIYSEGGNVSMRMEGTATEVNLGTIYNQADYTSITDLQLTFTWDFVNNTMSASADGSGILAAGSTGTISFSNSVAQDLSGVANLRSFRTAGQAQGASYMELDKVMIAYNRTFNNIWTGATDGDWATDSNWSTGVAPTSTDDVLIPDVANAPVIGSSTNVSVNDIVISESDGLTINSGGTLIVNGTSSGNVTYKRTLGTTNWYLMSSPVAGVTFDDAFVTANTIASGTTDANNRGVATYNTTTDNWTYLQFGGMINSTAGVGFSVKRSSVGTIGFTGTINTSDTGVDVVLETTGNRFNLLGNPYTSHVNSATFLASESAISDTQTIWVWNQGLGVAGSYEVQGTDDGFYLVPAQGFFVKANASGGTFNFAESNQSSTGGTFQKLNTTQIKLWISEGDVKNYCRIKYSDNATQGFDVGLDGEMFDGSESSFAIYSHLLADNEGKKYQLQALPNSDYEKMVVPVGVIASAGKQITFSAETMNLPAGLKVFLEDRVSNTFTRLDEANAEYSVTLDQDMSDIGRFYLHTTASALSTPEVNLQNVSIYATNANNLRIVGVAQGKANVKIFNILGKRVLDNNFTSNGVSDIFLPKLTRGIYIVQLTTEEGKLNKKIILE